MQVTCASQLVQVSWASVRGVSYPSVLRLC